MLPKPPEPGKSAAGPGEPPNRQPPRAATMKLHLDKSAQYNTITRYDAHHVQVGETRYESPLVVMPERIDADWHTGGFDSLDEAAFARLAQLAGDAGGRALLADFTVTELPAPSPACLDDVDTPAALAALGD